MINIGYKIHDHAIDLPKIDYQTIGAAGLDLYAANSEKISLSTLERYAIPTGISLAIPSGYEGQIRPRSGLFLKHGITINFGTIDSDYRGEIFILVVNLSKSKFIIERGMRVAQIVFNKFERVNLISKLELDTTLRGAGGFGSTGIKEQT